MLRTVSVAAVLVASVTSTALAKQKSFTWQNEMCENTIRYDTNKIKEQELKDTIFLLYEANAQLFVHGDTVSKPEDIDKLDFVGIQKQCGDKRAKLENLKLMDFAGSKKDLERLRGELIKKQTEICDFELVLMRGYKTPAALRDYKTAPQCEKFATALQDDTTIESAWRAFIPDMCADNANVKDCRERELKKAKLPDAKTHMRITLTGYAWNNCAISEVWRGNEKQQEELNQLALKFQKNFKAKEVCEEP
jgi:hypothetical protein